MSIGSFSNARGGILKKIGRRPITQQVTDYEFLRKIDLIQDTIPSRALNTIREAVINVLCHRDYTTAVHCQIRLYDDHLNLWNVGSHPPPLTPEILLGEHDSIPRNRKIVEAFFYMG